MKKSTISQDSSATKAAVFFASIKIRNVWAIVVMALVVVQCVHADTYTFANSNVSGATPTTPLDWLTGGPNT